MSFGMSFGKSPRHGIAPALALAFLFLPTSYAAPQATETENALDTAVRRLVVRMEDQSLEELWKSADRLTELGKEVIPILRKEIKRAGEKPRLGCSRVLLQLGDAEIRQEALSNLVDLVGQTKNTDIKVNGALVLAEDGDPDQVLDFLVGVFEKAVQPEVVIPLAKALWDLDRVLEARAKLLGLLDSRDPQVQQSAALALAEIDHFDAKVRNVLRELRHEPTLEGRLAESLYRNDQLYRRLEKSFDEGAAILPGADPAILLEQKEKRIRELEQKVEDVRRSRNPQGPATDNEVFLVLEELIRIIEGHYVEPRRVKRKDLIIAAAKGIARSLDQFTTFMDPEDTKRFMTDMSGEYCGIGAQVGKYAEESPLEILKPVYGGPAHRAGLLTGDQILEVDGTPTSGQSLQQIVNQLKGPEQSKIVLKVHRLGWEDAREFELQRALVEVPSVVWDMLPGKVGIIKLSQFGERSYTELEDAVLKLEEDGMEGLVLDLRNNPGGYLPTAVKIVDLFVGVQERPIVTQRGRDDDKREEEKRTFPTASRRPDYPLAILVNRRSASASEIVAGALKDYHRATLVGERTYGKGTVQTLYPLSERSQDILGGESRLKLTVKYYFLPSGSCIHTIRGENGEVIQEGGVEPNIVVEPESYPLWLLKEIDEIRSSRKVIDYVHAHYDALDDLARRGKSLEYEGYPEFEEFYKSLETHADRRTVGRIVRFHLRRKMEDAAGREFAGDFEDDPQLDQAILNVLYKLDLDPAKIPEYKILAKKAEEG